LERQPIAALLLLYAQATSLSRRLAPGKVATRYQATLYLLLAPYLLGAFLLVLLPTTLSFLLALTEYDAISPPVWRGWQNFATVLQDQLFLISIRNSALFVLFTVPLRLLGALALALLLNPSQPGVKIYRTAVYLPTVVPSVAYALIWLWIFNPVYGPLNLLLGSLGLPTPAWLVDDRTALPALALMALFQLGEGFAVLLAGLQEIPQDYYRAASLDGANSWQMFRYLTLPLLAPWLLLVTMRDIIVSVQGTFTPALLMTGGGPYYATLFAPLLIYETAFDRFRFGEGAAMMLLTFLSTGLLLLVVYKLVGGWGYADEV
jgi:multiple sugar transport system permease protein